MASELATDITSGNRPDKMAYDVAADILCTSGSVVVSTIIGNSVAGPIGAVAGFAIGSLINFFVDCFSYNGQTGRDHLKS